MTDSEVAELRARLEVLEARQAQRYGAPDIPHKADVIRSPGPFDYDPRHDPRYVAAVNANASNAQLARIEAEVRREIDARPHPGPVSAADIRAQERRANAAGLADRDTVLSAMTMPPAQPGAQVSRSPGGQTTVIEDAAVSCPSGHARPDPADRFCRLCGAEYWTADQLRESAEAATALSGLAARDRTILARVYDLEEDAEPAKPKQRTRKAV